MSTQLLVPTESQAALLILPKRSEEMGLVCSTVVSIVPLLELLPEETVPWLLEPALHIIVETGFSYVPARVPVVLKRGV